MNSKTWIALSLAIGFQLLGIASPLTAEASPVVPAPGLVELQDSFRQIAKRVLPSVVEVLTTTAAPETPAISPLEMPFGPLLQPDQPTPTKPQKAPKAQGLGSGILIRRDGDKVYVLTNNHVVDKAESIQITLNDGRKFEGKVVGADPRRDLALVSFTTKDPNVVLAALGNSDELQVGDWVMAIGNPLGLDFTVTHGIVSALGRRGGPDDTVNIDSYIQTDAPINRGNSGGALVNLKGEIVGVNTWIASPNGASVGLGFAVPINSAKRPIDQFIAHGAVQYGWLGAEVTGVSAEEAKALSLPSTEGSFISGIFRDSPAEKAGLLPGDFVVTIGGKSIHDTNDLVQTIGDLPVGENVDIQLIRQGQKVTRNVVIQARAQESAIAKLRLWPGLAVAELNDDLRSQFGLEASAKGVVVVEVASQSTGDVAGLKAGDIIAQLNDQPVRTLGDFYRLFNADNRTVKIGFVRQGVALSIGISR